MYAVIETGGKQYRVQAGDQVRVEKLKVKDGSTVEFDKVLVVGEGADIKIGTPYVEAAKVFGKAVETAKGDKVIIFKYKAKKDYRKKQGHRQPYTLVEIEGITADGTNTVKATPKKETKPKKESAAKKESATKTEASKAQPKEAAKPKADKPAAAKKKTPSLKSMKKAELIAFAKENKIEIDEKATNAVMIETIEKAMK